MLIIDIRKSLLLFMSIFNSMQSNLPGPYLPTSSFKLNIIIKVFAHLIFRIPYKFSSFFSPLFYWWVLSGFLFLFLFFFWLTFQTKVLAFSFTLKLYDPVIMTIMMASDHAVYINDQSYLATCLHSLLSTSVRPVKLPPCNLYLKVIKN